MQAVVLRPRRTSKMGYYTPILEQPVHGTSDANFGATATRRTTKGPQEARELERALDYGLRSQWRKMVN